MIKLLDGHSLTVRDTFCAEKFSLTLSERQSTATITIGPEAPAISTGDWLQDEDNPGAGIVWRVKSIDTDYASNTRTLNCEHIINALKDKIMFGDVTPSTMSGSVGATTCTALQAAQYILGQQSDFALGTFAYEKSAPYNFSSDSLLDALETVSSSLLTPFWTFSFDSYPFTLNVTQPSDAVQCEMRMDRNIRTLKKTVDRSRMYTRFYPIGKDNKKISGGGYVSKNENIYGTISTVETDNSLDTEQKLIDWANEKLNNHAEPIVTVTISGLELSEATGEPLDNLVLGTVCQVPLPEYDTTITERIIKLSWPDKVSDKESVTVTLANQTEDVASIVNKLNKSSKKGSKSHAKQGEQDHAWMVDTNDHIGLVAEAVAGEGADHDWSRVAQVMVDGEGVHQRVTKTEGDIVTAFSAIEATESKIYLVVADAKSDIRSEIVQTADEIRSDVSAASSTMYTVVSETATNFHTEVTKRAKVFVQLNDPASNPTTLATLTDGDIWIKSTRVQSWNDMANKTWSDASAVDWNRYTGAEQFVWDGVNNRWEPVSDKGQVVEWGTKIEQNEKNISLIARAIGAIDPSALAQLDVSAEAIQSAVSTSKSELYSVIRQTATNIVSYVANEQAGTMSYIDQTASSLTQTIARKNKVFVMMTDPVLVPTNTVIDGDIWIKSVADDKIKPTWNDLNAKSWSSQSTTNWRDYYSGAWYVRKNNAWAMMREDADVVEIGTKLEQDEKHIALIARDVDANHHELGSRLEVTAQHIRSEVHAAKSTLYSVIEQTATQIRADVKNTTDGLESSIIQTASSITTQVSAAEGRMSSSITQTALQIRADVKDTTDGLASSITQTASQIRSEVSSAVDGLQSSITQTASQIALVVDANGIKPAAIVAAINEGSSSIIISADHIDLDGYVKATDLTTDWLSTKIAAISNLSVNNITAASVSVLVGQNISPVATQVYVSGCPYDLRITSSGNTYTLQWKRLGYTAEWADVGSFSRAISSWVTGGGSGKINVTALPQNQTKSVNVSIDGNNSITSNGTYIYTVDYENDNGDDVSTGATKTVTVNVSGGGGTIDIPSTQIYVDDTSQGTKLSILRAKYEEAKSKSQYVMFRVDCGGSQKWYYMEP